MIWNNKGEIVNGPIARVLWREGNPKKDQQSSS